MNRKSIIVFLFLITTYINVISQEAIGLILGQNNGITSSYINPTFINLSTHSYEIQIAGAHAFFDTDYGYIEKSSLLNIINNYSDLDYVRFDNISNVEQGQVVFKTDNSSSHVDLKGEVLGPGFMINITPSIKLGLSSRSRAYAAVRSIPDILNFYNINNTFTETIYSSGAVSGSSLAWSEINAHLSYQLNPKIVIGGNIKYLVTHAGSYVDVPLDFSFVYPDTELVSAASDGQYTIASSTDHENYNNGSGYGIELGISIDNFLNTGSSLGISLLDIGLANINGQKLVVGYDNSILLSRSNYSNIESIDTLFNQVRSDFEIQSESNSLNIGLPTALSIQYKYPITEKYSMEGVFVQRLKFWANQLSRSNSLMISGVYDTKNISAFLPVTLYDYTRPKIGLAFRLFYLTIGSDDLLSLFGKSQNFDSTDLYINLRFYPFKLGKGNKKNKAVKCFTF